LSSELSNLFSGSQPFQSSRSVCDNQHIVLQEHHIWTCIICWGSYMTNSMCWGHLILWKAVYLYYLATKTLNCNQSKIMYFLIYQHMCYLPIYTAVNSTPTFKINTTLNCLRVACLLQKQEASKIFSLLFSVCENA
jgi:hypothetical protein